MNLFHEIKPGEKPPEEINVVIENCKGSSNKFEYDHENGIFKLDRVLYSSVFWPFDYGFIPQTWGEDEDPVDVVLLTNYPTFVGCVVRARPIGIIFMEDEKGIDNKIVAVPLDDPRFDEIRTIEDVSQHGKKEISEFFVTYKRLEPGKFVKFKAFKGLEEAKELIKNAMEAYKRKFKR